VSAVAFHSGVTDKIGYACRLLRKASRQGVRIGVVGDLQDLARLDQALWTFEHEEFVPHLLARAGAVVAPALRRTPIWLCDGDPGPAEASVIVNLGPRMVEGFERFERAIEIVSTDDDDARSARQRWRRYIELGCAPVNLPYRAAPA
jgi:DNA polymerase-3 subunit chi